MLHNGTGSRLTNGQGKLSLEPSLIAARETSVKQNDISSDNLFNILLRRKAPLVLGFLFFFALVAALTGLQRAFRPQFESSFQLLVSDPTDDGSARGGAGNNIGSQLMGMGNTVDVPTLTAVLQSRSLLIPAVEKFSDTLPAGSENKKNFQRRWEGFIEGKLDRLPLKIIQESGPRFQNLNVLKITYEDRDPHVAKAFLEYLGQAYIDYSLEQKNNKIAKGVAFLNQEYPSIRSRLEGLEAKIERFRENNALVEPLDQAKYLVSQINANQVELQKLATEKALKKKVLDTISANTGLNASSSIIDAQLSTSERYQSLLDELLGVKKKLAEARVKFTDEDPVVISLLNRQQALQQLVNAEAERILGRQLPPEKLQAVGNQSKLFQEFYGKYYEAYVEYTSLSASEAAIRENLNRLKQRFARFPALSREYTALLRQYNIANQNYQNFIEAREKLRLDLAQRITTWEIISAPVLDIEPIAPNILLNLLSGVLGGLIFGAAAAILYDRYDNVFHSSEEVKEQLPVPVLAEIPFRRALVRVRDAELPTSILEHLENEVVSPNSLEFRDKKWFEDSFVSLYSNLEFLNADTRIKSICVTSSIPAEGKSLTNIFLAKTLADFGKRVLLVDADLRKPKIHQHLKLLCIGLSNILSSDIEAAKVIQKISKNFSVITAGPSPPDPARLLSSTKMQTLMTQLSENYDYVIYDMPPLLGLPDGFFLAQHLDAMILLIALGKVSRTELTQVLRDIQFRQLPLSGCIINYHSAANRSTAAKTHSSYYYTTASKSTAIEKALTLPTKEK